MTSFDLFEKLVADKDKDIPLTKTYNMSESGLSKNIYTVGKKSSWCITKYRGQYVFIRLQWLS